MKFTIEEKSNNNRKNQWKTLAQIAKPHTVEQKSKHQHNKKHKKKHQCKCLLIFLIKLLQQIISPSPPSNPKCTHNKYNYNHFAYIFPHTTIPHSTPSPHYNGLFHIIIVFNTKFFFSFTFCFVLNCSSFFLA